MGMPTSRDITLGTGQKFPSSLGNALQDAIVALNNLLTAQSQGFWPANVSLAGLLTAGGGLTANGAATFLSSLIVANVWRLTGVITAPQLGDGSVTNDYAPAGIATANVIRVDVHSGAGGNATLTGLNAGNNASRLIILTCSSPGSSVGIALAQDTGVAGGSAAANRFLTPGGTGVAIRPGGSAILLYDDNASRWRPVSLS